MLCRARWARPDCLSSKHSLSFSQAGDFAAAGATRGQWKQTKSAVAPLTPSQRTPMFLILYRCFGKTEGILTKKTSDKAQQTWVRTEGFQRAIVDVRLSSCPLVASAEAKPLHKHAEEVCRSHQPNRANGSRVEDPCGVQRQRLWRLPLHSHPAYAPTAPSRLIQDPITISGTLRSDVRPLCGFRARIATYTHGSISSR